MSTPPKTVLVVEDEPAILKMCARILQDKGFVVLTASTVQAALDTCTHYTGSIDVLVADLFLPEPPNHPETMNGFEVAQRVRRVRPSIQVLFISGHRDHEIQVLRGYVPSAPILKKPFKPDEFVRTVQELLRRPATHP